MHRQGLSSLLLLLYFWSDWSSLLPIAAFLSLPIRGCLPKSTQRIVPGMWSFRGLSSLAAQRQHRGFPVQESTTCLSSPHLQELLLWSGPLQSTAMCLEPAMTVVLIHLPADPTADPLDLNVGHFQQLQSPRLLQPEFSKSKTLMRPQDEIEIKI